MSIGRRIRAARKAAKLTQIELSESAGIAVNSLRRYEAGQRSPTLGIVEKLAQALKVPILQLLQDEHEKEMIPMYRNLEHYADPTAGDALSKTRIPQRGEVWFATRKNVAESHMVLVIRNGPSIANIVELYDKIYDDCYVVRIAPNICKYYSPARYSWEQYGHFIKRVGKLEDSEFEKVLHNLNYTHNFGR